MSDDRSVYADGKLLSDLSYNWEECCRSVVIDADLHCRPLAETHAIVRDSVAGKYGDEDAPELLRYLLAPAEQVRRRLHLRGYTPRSIRELWTRAHARHVARLIELAGAYADGAFWEEVQALQHVTFEIWAEQQEQEFDYERHMRFGGVLDIDLMDSFAHLALHIDVRKPQAIWTDLTDLYPNEFDPELSVRDNLGSPRR